MHLSPTACLALVLLGGFLVANRKVVVAAVRALQSQRATNAVMAAYRSGDYATALERTEGLKADWSNKGHYCFMRGGMLHHLGRLTEAEASLREGLPYQLNSQLKALSYNTLAKILMDQGRYTESIAFFENAGKAWSGRGSNLSGIAEVWLRQGRELPEAFANACQAVEIDRSATGLTKEIVQQRLGEDLAVLAWAMAENGDSLQDVDSLVNESLALCSKAKPILGQVHYHVGRAYAALGATTKSQEHFRQASEIDPQGIFGAMARSTIASSGM